MYCGNCFRDNALVRALRELGHTTLMVPLYLPMTLEDQDQSAGTPIFFGGVSVYLEQKSALFRHAPAWLHQLLAAPRFLKWASSFAAKTRAEDLGELTLSMLRGEEGRQARELDELIGWLKTQPRPDVICLSNALLAGRVRRLRAELRVPVVCMLQGEDAFLDALPPTQRDAAWATLSARAAEVDLFIAPSRYFGDRMRGRLSLPPEKVRVVHNGINLAGFAPAAGETNSAATGSGPPVLGYFARLCREKGLDTLIEAFLLLKQRTGTRPLRLRVGGGCGPGDEPFVRDLRRRLEKAGVLGDVDFFPNVDRAGKLAFFCGLSVFSVPALYGEAFGLYVLEALAAGVPVVQPRHAAFPELLEATGGGVLCAPGDAGALADAIEKLVLNPEHTRQLGLQGQKAVRERFSAEAMTSNMVKLFEEAVTRR